MTFGSRQFCRESYTPISSLGADWSYSLQDRAQEDIAAVPTSFLVSLGSTSLINHINPLLRVCIWGAWPKQPSKKFQGGRLSTCCVRMVTTSYCGHYWGRTGRSHGQVALILLLWRQTCWALSQGCFPPGMMLLWKHRAWSLQEHSVLIPAALSICFVSH